MPSTNSLATDPHQITTGGNLASLNSANDYEAVSKEIDELAIEDEKEAQLIKELGENALKRAKRGGDLLLSVKKELGHGEFMKWQQRKKLKIARTTAGNWMIIAAGWPTLEERFGPGVRNMSYSEVLKELTESYDDPEFAVSAERDSVREDWQNKTRRLWIKTDPINEADVARTLRFQQAHKVHAARQVSRLDRPVQAIERLFLDSGAYSQQKMLKEDPSYYNSPKFLKRLEQYGEFLQEHHAKFDYYANLDAIGDATATFRNQLYLEKTFNLKPVPVLHFKKGNPTNHAEWLPRYRDDLGHTYIGVGGVTKKRDCDLEPWLDQLFKDGEGLRFHAFGLMSLKMLQAYPWHSADASTWTQTAGKGSILLPRRCKEKDGWDYSKPAQVTKVSTAKGDPEHSDGEIERLRVRAERLENKVKLLTNQTKDSATEAKRLANEIKRLNKKIESLVDQAERLAAWKVQVSARVNSHLYDTDALPENWLSVVSPDEAIRLEKEGYSRPPDMAMEKHSSWSRLANLYYYERLAAYLGKKCAEERHNADYLLLLGGWLWCNQPRNVWEWVVRDAHVSERW